MKVAILGGTFNPVHNGHLNIASAVRSRLRYERIVFVPANIPAHKTVEGEPGAEHRLRMLQLATAGCSAFTVDDCELRRGGTSYTIDTVEELIASHPIDGKPGLIIGDDLAKDFESWRQADQLAEMVELIVAHRQSREQTSFGFPCLYIDNSLFPISSSQIRKLLQCGRRGESVRRWLPPEVYAYIERNDLYG